MAETDLYNAEFMDHVVNPDYNYKLHAADCSLRGVNPSCGDELTFSVKFAEDGTISEAAYTGHGCAISQASADIMSDVMVGKTPAEARRLCALFTGMLKGEVKSESELEPLEDGILLKDISHMPARVKCAELAWNTMVEMLDSCSKA